MAKVSLTRYLIEQQRQDGCIPPIAMLLEDSGTGLQSISQAVKWAAPWAHDENDALKKCRKSSTSLQRGAD
jgi:hypothetical protein